MTDVVDDLPAEATNPSLECASNVELLNELASRLSPDGASPDGKLQLVFMVRGGWRDPNPDIAVVKEPDRDDFTDMVLGTASLSAALDSLIEDFTCPDVVEPEERPHPHLIKFRDFLRSLVDRLDATIASEKQGAADGV
jgi:hypothetical protein